MSFKPRASRVRSGINASWLLTAAISVGTTSALAHHSPNMFDATKTIEVKGTVKEFHWTNPHTWVVIESRDPAGKVSEWSFEANGPGYMVRNGWKRESLKPGDKITVTANPMRDGSQGGNLVEVATADGRKLSARVGGPPPPGADGQKAPGARP